MTNADKIRNMSNEELAKLVTGSLSFDCSNYCNRFQQGVLLTVVRKT